jgi:hypothetical protein
MNKLYLIGNGFDLAHGLKTRYSDFLLWYINKSIRLFNESKSNIYKDDLMVLDSNGYKISEFESLKTFKECLSKLRISIQPKNILFENILNQSDDQSWVDIEYEYYSILLTLYKKIEKHNSTKFEGSDKLIKDVNNCFEFIKEQLIEYLKTIQSPIKSKEIESRFNSELQKKNFDKVLFLVFNYTNTIELYLNLLKLKSPQVIYIHGQLGDDKNPIIFGYGDEMDEYYQKLENLNLNEFLKNMKAFSYLKTSNYKDLSRFIGDGDYTISIMGHSCGLSDRVLLNSIFCHKNCRGIRIFFYKKDEMINDFFEKTQEISRHFTIEQKNRMRNLIVSFSNSSSLT